MKKIIAGLSLIKGKTISCGCYKNEVVKRKKVRSELVGKKYGRLTVIERAPDAHPEKTKQKVRWRCRCDCGNETIVDATYLKTGKIKSCGCYNREVQSELKSAKLEGQTFGHLSVIQRVDFNDGKSKGHVRWKCKCKCGSIIYPTSGDLLSGHTTSCGCIRSKGELIVATLLRDNGVEFDREKRFIDLYDKGMLSFDFYISNNRTAIEYNGQQHYSPIGIFGGNEAFEKQQLHDLQKREYCQKNGIRLIELPYT